MVHKKKNLLQFSSIILSKILRVAYFSRKIIKISCAEFFAVDQSSPWFCSKTFPDITKTGTQ